MFDIAVVEKALNNLVQAQSCDIAVHLTKEMNKYPKGSPEQALLKSMRFGIAYGCKSDDIITIHRDYSAEDMTTRYRAVFKKEVSE